MQTTNLNLKILVMAMRRMGLNQSQIAFEMGYNRSVINKILHGAIEPTDEFITRLYNLIAKKGKVIIENY